MSDDRLNDALEAMKREDVDASTLEDVRGRVWSRVAGDSGCAEFRAEFPAYLSGAVGDSRRLLVDDHLSHCPACRAILADMKGERRVIPMPRRASRRWLPWGSLAAAAALLFAVVYVARDDIDAMMAPGGPRATVVSTAGGLYRLAGGTLAAGAPIGEKESIRTGPGARAVLRLADGSLMEVNGRTELFVTAAWSGQSVHLQRGDVIVRAAKQRRGHLRVLTHDSVASVKGTVFAVSAGLGGSLVSVVEGAVAVSQPGREVLLRPGEQASSNPALATSVADAIEWSPSAAEYLEILGSLAHIERQVAAYPVQLRTRSALLAYLPSDVFVYGALPNLGDTIGHAMVAAEQEASLNPTFGTWWNSGTGQVLRQTVDRLQSVSSMLGEEVVLCAALPGAHEQVPMVMARLQPGKRPALASALDALFAKAGETPLPYSASEELLVVSDTALHLQWALNHLGQGGTSPFAVAVADRYKRGVGWLIAMDAPPVVKAAAGDDAPPVEFAGMLGVKYLFLEQRAPAGSEENELTLTFHGQRTGIASWLADAGSAGAAEYLPADVLAAGYVSTREPQQLFEEFLDAVTKEHPTFGGQLTGMSDQLGAGFIDSLTRAMGTEAAFAFHGFSTTGPTWTMAALVNDPTAIDRAMPKLVEVFNSQLGPDEQVHRLVLGQETVNGRQWNTLKPGGFPFGITWTYDRGYMVMASDRALAERAIATRNGGAQLIWSSEFLRQLPTSGGLHPSAFGWLNTKGGLGLVSVVAPSPALTKLMAEHDPVLAVFDGSAEQIHGASRSRLTGLLMDVMLLEGMTRTQAGPAANPARH